MGEILLFSITRTITRLERINEMEPTAAPYVVAFVVVLWLLVFAVNKFTDHINRK